MLGDDIETQMGGEMPPECKAPVETWLDVRGAWHAGRHRQEFVAAQTNGLAFLNSADGLRGRRPHIIEWKGGHKAPESEAVPVDLRIDHVYLVSCKYASNILLNASPFTLFTGEGNRGGDWFLEQSLDSYQSLYAAVRSEAALSHLPPFVDDITKDHRAELKAAFGKGERWPSSLKPLYLEFAMDVSRASAAAWKRSIRNKAAKEKMLWHLLRIGSAPYFILGASKRGSMRLRVTTPWDWRRRFRFKTLDVWGEEAGQPRVAWSGVVYDGKSGEDRVVEGHVEVRWSHGRFGGHPEAKVYLETPHERVPGYVPLK